MPELLPDWPGYGTSASAPGSISTVLSSSAAALGAEGFTNQLGLPTSNRVVVVLVDGLGAALLKRKGAHAPFLRSVLGGGSNYRVINSAFPSTTASSLSSLGTGVEPGLHGMVGYDVLDPDQDKIVNLLGNWDHKVDPLRWQPQATVFERLEGVLPTATVSLAKFANSPMTQAALRGSRFVPANSVHARTQSAAELLAEEKRMLLYLYWSELDKAGHRYGVDSVQWENELEELDAGMRRLSSQLPAGTLLLLTADHGMVDVPEASRIDFSTDSELIAGVRHTGGEPRLVQLYLEADADPEALKASWQRAWGSQAWIFSRAEAIAAGYFGTVRPEVAPRIGDLLIAAREPVAFYDARRVRPTAMEVVGQHGSLTRAEREIPLIRIPVTGTSGRPGKSGRKGK
ncbi:putative AlkP superfamily pyrophosphatase or phosphodiesterase [Psychromicrobium silvestre]|uniref:Putative AlkP superfamily pyrophosphatase or phosphodiesterase n=1 Tax=Psychromicrobium silvestre TaxID=1645614 RepID=A0A7Y9LR34_9MICC|nr:alkaline phosphatase family protein [Psychromicrobium silvestre]NYE94047.1 putative AlkP superfamily pyrophosphatase or phosphodiesterase [Psychromicrobium silvestre]